MQDLFAGQKPTHASRFGIDMKNTHIYKDKCKIFGHKWATNASTDYRFCEWCTLEINRPPCQCEIDEFEDAVK